MSRRNENELVELFENRGKCAGRSGCCCGRNSGVADTGENVKGIKK